MRRGEAPPISKPDPSAAPAVPPMGRTIVRLMALIGGVDSTGFRIRLWVSIGLTLAGKVLAVVSPLVLADGINALADGRGAPEAAALQAFIGFTLFWASLRFLSTAGRKSETRCSSR